MLWIGQNRISAFYLWQRKLNNCNMLSWMSQGRGRTMMKKKMNCGYKSMLAQDHYHVQLIGTVPGTKTQHMQFCVSMSLQHPWGVTYQLVLCVLSRKVT